MGNSPSKSGEDPSDQKQCIKKDKIRNITSKPALEIERLSTHQREYCEMTGLKIIDVRKQLAKRFGVNFADIECVCLEKGIIYPNERPVADILKPIQLTVGNPDRKILTNLAATEPDMFTEDVSEPRLKMSCGHAITPDSLFGHMKKTLMSQDKQGVRCKNCRAEWSMQEIIKKADMTKDERIFFEYKVSLNMINQEDADSSECPFCGTYCQRQNQNELHIRCTTCTRRTKKVVEFCWNCKRSWTTNHKCKLNTKHELEQIQRFLNEAPLKVMEYSNNRNVPSTRLCPGCGYLIVHEEDCQEMECKKCNLVFCFSCLKVGVKNHSGENCVVAPVQICS